MLLIAKIGFKNNAKEYIEFDKGHEPVDSSGETVPDRHPDGVHKGARFSIGGDKKIEEMKNMQKHLTVIRQLASAEVIGDGNDKDLCKKIDQEVKTEKRQREEAARLAAAGSSADIARNTVSAMQEAGWTAPKAKAKVEPPA